MPSCDTLVQYMGGREAAATARRFLAQGGTASTPVVVENCSRDNQLVLRLKLNQLEQDLQQCEGPVLVMIGPALATCAPQTLEDQKKSEQPAQRALSGSLIRA